MQNGIAGIKALKFYFRVDASVLIGSGHVMRSLTLACALKAEGHNVILICREYPGNLIDLICHKGFAVKVLAFTEQEAYQRQAFSNDYTKWLWVNQQKDAEDTQACVEGNPDWIVIDHYGLDYQFENELRAYTKKIMVIDDLANRSHACDLLLDQNFYLNLQHRYDKLCPETCKKLLGPEYALIREEFLNVCQKRQVLNKFSAHPIQNILVYMGGADPNNITQSILSQLIKLPKIANYHIDVVVGLINPHQQSIMAFCKMHSFLTYHCQPGNYLELLTQTDLAIAAGGASSYERCLIGLPGIVYAIAENQNQICVDLSKWGAQMHLENIEELVPMIQSLNDENLAIMAQKGMSLFSHHQGVQGVINALQSY